MSPVFCVFQQSSKIQTDKDPQAAGSRENLQRGSGGRRGRLKIIKRDVVTNLDGYVSIIIQYSHVCLLGFIYGCV